MKIHLLAAAWPIAVVVPLLSAAALAQSGSTAPAARPEPLNAEAALAPAEYRSAFTGYRPLVEEKIAPWKETNDTAGRIGGWRAYAKEAREDAPAQATQATPNPDSSSTPPGAQKPMPGHKMN